MKEMEEKIKALGLGQFPHKPIVNEEIKQQLKAKDVFGPAIPEDVLKYALDVNPNIDDGEDLYEYGQFVGFNDGVEAGYLYALKKMEDVIHGFDSSYSPRHEDPYTLSTWFNPYKLTSDILSGMFKDKE